MAKIKYEIALFLKDVITREKYMKWLQQAAKAHLSRDKKRGNTSSTATTYKEAIHAAVSKSGGLDFYTGEELDWSLLGIYDNVKSEVDRSLYKKTLYNKPTIDHYNGSPTSEEFVICSWQLNDAKNDMSHDELIELCHRVIKHEKGKIK